MTIAQFRQALPYSILSGPPDAAKEVFVYDSNGDLASLFTDISGDTPLDNPVFIDPLGEIEFAIEEGTYTIAYPFGGASTRVDIVVTSDTSAGVSSFNTRAGAVTLSKEDVTGTGLAPSDIGAATASDVTEIEADLGEVNTTLGTIAASGAVVGGIHIFAYAGNPNGNVAALAIGDQCFDVTNGYRYRAAAADDSHWDITDGPGFSITAGAVVGVIFENNDTDDPPLLLLNQNATGPQARIGGVNWFTHAGDPNGVVTALAKGDVCNDTSTPKIWLAAGAGTTWT